MDYVSEPYHNDRVAELNTKISNLETVIKKLESRFLCGSDTKETPISKKDIYKALTNYIHNELHITRAETIEVMNQKVEQILTQKIEELFNSRFFRVLVEMKVMQFINEGKTDSYYDRESFEKFVTEIARNKVYKMIDDKYDIEVKTK